MHGNITLEESTPFCQETMKDIGALSILLEAFMTLETYDK
jgi:hypothetical protein